jgi:hypothetical protein
MLPLQDSLPLQGSSLCQYYNSQKQSHACGLLDPTQGLKEIEPADTPKYLFIGLIRSEGADQSSFSDARKIQTKWSLGCSQHLASCNRLMHCSAKISVKQMCGYQMWYNPSTWEADVGIPQVQGQPGLHSKLVSKQQNCVWACMHTHV